MDQETSPVYPEGLFSLLDTDLYKLTMQCAVLKYFPEVSVTYGFTNRTPDMKLSRVAYKWLLEQIRRLANIGVTAEELRFLQTTCTYFNEAYLRYLGSFRLKPAEQITITFRPVQDTGSDDDLGDIEYSIKGLWVETILYEIPLLALTSEAYFRFCDQDWNYDSQEERAYRKGCCLLQNGCLFSEFGSRRRRDYHTHDLVMRGLCRAAEEARRSRWEGTFSGTSNVHFAMKYGVNPIGTVAHEWYMAIAACTNDYRSANELGLRYWLGCFGEGVLGIALTDTFGTPAFFDAFKNPIPDYTLPSASSTTIRSTPPSPARTEPPIPTHIQNGGNPTSKTYAQAFQGIRQDSGDPAYFVKMARDFYDKEGIKDKKTVVFSDSLNVELCLEYKAIAEEAGFQPVFGVGTFFTNDFNRKFDGKKSLPLNIVIKISSAGGRPAVKLSDNMGKNTGDKSVVQDVKKSLGYIEHTWEKGDNVLCRE
ncbi:hypothetical protein Egran_05827 [Elaphomyces granulatus]|uniref:nicotinate phosphoribosyltransferase n=1 Tax=Elaphomyces granulatus TaxID=519963 RepID=A0A232LQG8_9EURO|nr:hypothetical protein Egran_05827 [Elaphomyces granulatus]